jgi:uncharacterized protein
MQAIAQTTQAVLMAGLALAVVLGFTLHRSHFCTMGAISDWVLMGGRDRARQWALAVAVATLGFGLLTAAGWVSPLNTIYNTPQLPWLAYALGGVLFGVGMVLASGCLSKTLVRLGAGNLKALVVLLVAAIAALATLRGALAVLRVRNVETVSLDWGQGPFLPQWAVPFLSQDMATASLWSALGVGGALLLWVWRGGERLAPRTLFGGLLIGLVTVGLWAVSGIVGWVPEHPETLEAVFLATASGRMEAMSFTAPLGYWLDGLLYYSDGSKQLYLGMVLVPGVLLGAALSAWHEGSFRWEGFAGTADLVRHLVGAVLMGAGGVMAMGCTIGQGISGLSTLNLGSLLAVAGIVLGAVLVLRWDMR